MRPCLFVVLPALSVALLSGGTADAFDYRPPPITTPKRPPGAWHTPRNCHADLVRALPELIRREWMHLLGPNGQMGCPTSLPHAHPEYAQWHDHSTSVKFENGSISTNPTVWPHGALGVYQSFGGLVVDFNAAVNGPAPRPYDKFILRWTVNKAGRATTMQADVMKDICNSQAPCTTYGNDVDIGNGKKWTVTDVGSSTAATVWPRMDGEADVLVTIQGCQSGFGRSSSCDPDFIRADNVHYTTDGATFSKPNSDGRAQNFSQTDTLDFQRSEWNMSDSKKHFEDRQAEIVRHYACDQTLPQSFHRNEMGAVAFLARLAYADYFQSDVCPGRDVSNRQEAFGWIMQQLPTTTTGTTVDGHVPYRTGEYDVVLARLIPAIYRYFNVMPVQVRRHIIDKLLVKRGPFDGGDNTVMGVAPETENHLLQIHSSQYLTNEILFEETKDPQFDNFKNGNDAFLLAQLQDFLKFDFREYNSRAYTKYSMAGILNLASYTSERTPTGRAVKTAATMVLDYLSAKMVLSSNTAQQRIAPYRRHVRDDDTFSPPSKLFDGVMDPWTGVMVVLTGNVSAFQGTSKNAIFDPWVPNGTRNQTAPLAFVPATPVGDLAIMTALNDYRLPDVLLQHALAPFPSVQAFHLERIPGNPIIRAIPNPYYPSYSTDELYARSSSYVISAGGRPAPPAYTAAFVFDDGEDRGNVMPTTLFPVGLTPFREDLIRFEGEGGRKSSDRTNMCVAKDFACGLRLDLPDKYTKPAPDRAACVKTVDARGNLVSGDHGGNWIFFDEAGACARSAGTYYVAAWRATDTDHFLPSFGLFEAREVGIINVVKFDDFAKSILAKNPHPFHMGRNTYVKSDGGRIDFTLDKDSEVLSAPEQPTRRGLASGTFMNSSVPGRITISYPGGDTLVLDHTDIAHPRREILHGVHR